MLTLKEKAPQEKAPRSSYGFDNEDTSVNKRYKKVQECTQGNRVQRSGDGQMHFTNTDGVSDIGNAFLKGFFQVDANRNLSNKYISTKKKELELTRELKANVTRDYHHKCIGFSTFDRSIAGAEDTETFCVVSLSGTIKELTDDQIRQDIEKDFKDDIKNAHNYIEKNPIIKTKDITMRKAVLLNIEICLNALIIHEIKEGEPSEEKDIASTSEKENLTDKLEEVRELIKDTYPSSIKEEESSEEKNIANTSEKENLTAELIRVRNLLYTTERELSEAIKNYANHANQAGTTRGVSYIYADNPSTNFQQLMVDTAKSQGLDPKDFDRKKCTKACAEVSIVKTLAAVVHNYPDISSTGGAFFTLPKDFKSIPIDDKTFKHIPSCGTCKARSDIFLGIIMAAKELRDEQQSTNGLTSAPSTPLQNSCIPNNPLFTDTIELTPISNHQGVSDFDTPSLLGSGLLMPELIQGAQSNTGAPPNHQGVSDFPTLSLFDGIPHPPPIIRDPSAKLPLFNNGLYMPNLNNGPQPNTEVTPLSSLRLE